MTFIMKLCSVAKAGGIMLVDLRVQLHQSLTLEIVFSGPQCVYAVTSVLPRNTFEYSECSSIL